ncbi:hypothetical protein SLA2020_319340 [Shorea laevis]
MGSLIWFSQILCLSFMLLQFQVQSSSPSQSSVDSPPLLCRPEERSALLDFKSTTNLRTYCFVTPRLIIQTWNESKDCCLWEGITCDKMKGHVIGLDLSSNCLKADLTTNSSLFGLEKLQSLSLSDNYFHYPNISFGFNRWKSLTYLNLSRYMDGSLPFDEIFLLSKLVSLDLFDNYGLLVDNIKFQMLVHNLTELKFLILDSVNMSLVVPSSLVNLTSSLEHLSLSNCLLQGNFPSQVFQLTKLILLNLSYNDLFLDNIKFQMLVHNLTELRFFILDFVNMSLVVASSWLNLTSSLEHLSLSSCNLLEGQILDVIGKMHKLTHLSFSNNNFGGEIPASISNLTHLTFLSLSSNKLSGSLPILSTTWDFMGQLFLSGNNLTGKIPSSYCNLTSLGVLDLGNNNLEGKIPECLGNLSNLSVLDLQMNKFHGRILNSFVNMSKLRTLHLNGNQLEGILSLSLVNCSNLEILDVGNNNLNDTFPHWLGVLPSLKVLILRSNRFHGAINNSMLAFYFPQLRIIDVAQNDFMDLLPNNYFKILKGMRDVAPAITEELEYIDSSKFYYKDYVKILVKGSVVELEKILKIFTTIDFSSNQFHGPIREELGELNSLFLLNLSYNSLNGQIPSSLGKLTELEALDLSSNKLEGWIPKQLTNLTFLSILNLSHNELVGLIPEGKQFNTFLNDPTLGTLGCVDSH